MHRNFLEQKGVSLLISVLILSMVLAVSLGVSSILLGEFKISRDITRFAPAIYAADTGVEQALYKIRKLGQFSNGSCPTTASCVIATTALSNGATYSVVVVDGGATSWCGAQYTSCLRSAGTFQGINRQLEAKF